MENAGNNVQALGTIVKRKRGRPSKNEPIMKIPGTPSLLWSTTMTITRLEIRGIQ